MTFPITPPDEIVQQWRNQWMCHFDDIHPAFGHDFQQYVITQAAQWGRDQRGAASEAELQQARDEELNECCEWMRERGLHPEYWRDLRAARRPMAQSKAESALNALDHILRHSQTDHGANTIRLALERLKELEGAND